MTQQHGSEYPEYPHLSLRRIAREFFGWRSLLLSLAPLVIYFIGLQLSSDGATLIVGRVGCAAIALLSLPYFRKVYISQWARVDDVAKAARDYPGRDLIERKAYRIFMTIAIVAYIVMIVGFCFGNGTLVVDGLMIWLLYIALNSAMIQLDEDRTAHAQWQRDTFHSSIN